MQAETMNAPSSAASIRYSGQWARKDPTAPNFSMGEGCTNEEAGSAARFDITETVFCSMLFMESAHGMQDLWGSDKQIG